VTTPFRDSIVASTKEPVTRRGVLRELLPSFEQLFGRRGIIIPASTAFEDLAACPE
jgi:hypothetical protein